MKKSIILLVIVLLAACYASGKPVETGQISADANWVVRFDYEQFLKSDLGQLLTEQLKTRGIEEKLSNFNKIFGFHPLDDMRSIMLYGQGDNPEKAVVLAQGSFNKDKFLALIGMNSDYKEIDYNSFVIYQWFQKDKNAHQDAEGKMIYGCFFQDDMVVLGTGLLTVKHAIEVLKGSASSASNEVFSDTLLQNENAFLQVASKDLSQIAGNKPEATILKQTDQLIIVSGQSGESVFATIKLTAKTEENAGLINNMLEGVKAYLALDSEKRPGLSKLAQKIQVSSSDKTIKIDLELKSEVIEQIILNHIDKIEISQAE